jgi:hypothetical protein
MSRVFEHPSTAPSDAPVVEHAYRCTNAGCRDRDFDVTSSLSPREHRLATGRTMACNTCGAIMVWKWTTPTLRHETDGEPALKRYPSGIDNQRPARTPESTRAAIASIRERRGRCADECPGWGIYDHSDRGIEVERCDACLDEGFYHATPEEAAVAERDRILDKDVQAFPEAREALAAAIASGEQFEEQPQ